MKTLFALAVRAHSTRAFNLMPQFATSRGVHGLGETHPKKTKKNGLGRVNGWIWF